MLRINFACFLYFEAFISFELIWTSLNTEHSLLWIPIMLHYVGIVLKLALIKYSDYKVLWIAVVGNDGVVMGLLNGENQDLTYLYVYKFENLQVLILIQFELLHDTKMFYNQSILVLYCGMVSQIIQNYMEVRRLMLTLGECLMLLTFLYFINRKTKNAKSDQCVQQEMSLSAKLQILKLMPWMTDQKFIVLNDHFKCVHNQSDLYVLMECDKEEAIETFLDVRCDAFSLNLIKLLSENNTTPISSPFQIHFTKPDIRTILQSILSDVNSYYSYFSVAELDNKNLGNVKLNFFVLSDNFIDYLIVQFEPQMKSNSKSIYSVPENLKQNNTNIHYNNSNHSKQTYESLSSEILGNIFQSISHEFGTFLNCILTDSSEAMDSELINEQVKAIYIEPTYINSKLLSYVLQNVRDFNTILLKQFALRLQEFSPYEIIQEIQYLLNQQKTQRNNQIIVNCPQHLLVYNDQDRFKQVLYQLMSNSVRFTENGIITVSIDFYKDKIKVRVSDNGIGMNQFEQQKLHKLLRDNKNLLRISHNSVGCGLGLSISNAIVLKMNGKHGIQFTSEQQKGSEFFFTISNSQQLYNDSVYVASQTYVKVLNQTYYLEQQPISEGSHKEQQIQNSEFKDENGDTQRVKSLFSKKLRCLKSADSKSFQGQTPKKLQLEEDEIESRQEESNIMIPSLQASFKSEIVKFSIGSNCCSRVLIVDDEYFNIQSLQLILHRYNAHCDFTFNGQEAIKKSLQKMKEPCRQCQNNGYVLFFLDLNMPIMDGFDTVKNLKKMMHDNLIPKGICIANTGYADLESKQQAINSGMDFYMIKPIQIKELQTYLKRKFPQ
ncbi:unnamed protein product (macronuclear) [Paramecium tetraurelia]|uniref:Response regulatory domain-containing protein n=1 Tax=Paramecium tetraurelia TaxID=5888 RepID=A0DDQ6_PARTE|nr:uncharacterized protein GSPATT00016014001 [Paramecium tetraurelia]CAK81173.1 unnamed protein product [Paramecium tetraurelia]|eukprot:XP_001448570.1 hypothetical protein (macronuclear) [Paramecium tetraurelia strain d4-2]